MAGEASDRFSEYDLDVDTQGDRSHFLIRYRSNSLVSSNLSDPGPVDSEPILPTIKVLGTGGTIASKGSNAHQTAGYKVDLTIEDLIKSIPDLSTTCNLEYEQVMNVDSGEMGTDEILTLSHKIHEDLNKYDGFVVTHGTDTMEETAFFLQLTIHTYKPIVMCGSMRPSTAVSSDGPMNLYQAISIAAHRSTRGRGVLMALNDRIGSGFHITKSNANSLDTFKSSNHGDIGHFVNNEIHYYFPPAKPLGITYFDVRSATALPEVSIIFAHQGLNNKLIELAYKGLGSQGLVFATMGAGTLAAATFDFVGNLFEGQKVPLVYSKRTMDGMVPVASLPATYNSETAGARIPFTNNIAGGYLNPQKSRILLQLCLNDEMTTLQIKDCFRGVYGG